MNLNRRTGPTLNLAIEQILSPMDKILFVIFDNFKSERLGIQILSSIALEEGYQRSLLIVNSMSLEVTIIVSSACEVR